MAALPKFRNILDNNGIYMTEGARMVCGEHAGATAQATGKSIHGIKLIRVTPSIYELYGCPKCEECGKTLAPSELASIEREKNAKAEEHARLMTIAFAKPDDPTPEAFKAQLDAVFTIAAERIGYLYARWQDESEYESFDEYIAEFRKLLPDGYTFVGASKRPFGFSFSVAGLGNARYLLTTTTRTASLKRVNA